MEITDNLLSKSERKFKRGYDQKLSQWALLEYVDLICQKYLWLMEFSNFLNISRRHWENYSGEDHKRSTRVLLENVELIGKNNFGSRIFSYFLSKRLLDCPLNMKQTKSRIVVEKEIEKTITCCKVSVWCGGFPSLSKSRWPVMTRVGFFLWN